jgi:hypothetical protein
MKVKSGEEEEMIVVCIVTMNWCVRRRGRNKVVPEIHFAALLKLEVPARTITVESTLALNPWYFGAKAVHVHTPGTQPPHCKAIHDSLSVLPKLEKS